MNKAQRIVVHPMICLMVLAGAGIAHAQEKTDATRALEELFGDRLTATADTPSVQDDIDLFAEILAITATIKEPANIHETACLMAVERLGTKPGGHETAVKAINGLIKKYPDKWESYIVKLVEVREHQARFGARDERRPAAAAQVACMLQLAAVRFEADESVEGVKQVREALLVAKRYRLDSTSAINELLDGLAHIERAEREIEVLKNRLKANPTDEIAAKKLVWIYLLDRNDIEEARKYAFLLNDEEFTERVKQATSPVGEIDKATAETLSNWYESLTDDPTMEATQKQVAMGNAVKYLERYLELHPEKDLERVKAEIRLRKLKEAANTEPEAPTAPSIPPRLPGR